MLTENTASANITTNTANYVQPLSVPLPRTIYITSDDPRNNIVYLKNNPNITVLNPQDFARLNIKVSQDAYSTIYKLAANQINLIPPNASSFSSTNILNIAGKLATTSLVTSTTPYSDQLTANIGTSSSAVKDSSNPAFLSTELNDPYYNTFISDFPVIAQPEQATPTPVFPVDFPENLYIDPTAFQVVKAANGSITYKNNIIFDDVDNATDYEIRLVVAG